MSCDKFLSLVLKVCFLFVICLVLVCHGIRWVGLFRAPATFFDKEISYEDCDMAAVRYGLNKRQVRFCRDPVKRTFMPIIIRAAQVVAYHCPSTFSDRRWNCSSVRALPHRTVDIKTGTREQAVVHAFSGAAIVFEIARHCTDGKLKHCECGTEPPMSAKQHMTVIQQQLLQPQPSTDNSNSPSTGGDPGVSYIISGCHDNVEMGKQIARDFLGYHKFLPPSTRNEAFGRRKRQRRRPPTMKLLNAHNYQAGMELMEKLAVYKCQCHGVSGSCSQKTCFRQLTRLDIPIVQDRIKDNYLNAVKVVHTGDFQLQKEVFKDGVFINEAITKDDFLFVQHSPDYCNYDPSVGSQGTKHRLCQPKGELDRPNDCVNMCCGRGYYEQHRTSVETCNCRRAPPPALYEVVCDNCTVRKSTNHCN